MSQNSRCVNFAVCGKFHVINHISYLRKAGYLNRFYYSHPRPVEPGHSFEEYVRLPLKEYLIQGHARVTGRFLDDLDSIYSSIWARSVLARWVQAPLFHFIALGHSVRLISRAREDGARIIAGAVNTHPENRRSVMEAEAAKWKLPNVYKKLAPHEMRIDEEIEAADILLAPSHHVADTFRKYSTPKRTAVIPFAVNVARFRPAPGQYERAGSGPLKILTVGQIGLRKGQLYVLEALARFPVGAIELTLVGQIDPVVKRRLAEFRHLFRHIPRIPNEELARLHREYDLYILTSLEEGLAGSMCEAMGSGLAVACTPETGIEEIVSNGVDGYVLRSRSVDAVEEFLQFALANRGELVEVGVRAALKAAQQASWAAYADRLMRLYDDLLVPPPNEFSTI